VYTAARTRLFYLFCIRPVGRDAKLLFFYGPTVLKKNRTAAPSGTGLPVPRQGGGSTQAADWDRAKARSLVGGVLRHRRLKDAAVSAFASRPRRWFCFPSTGNKTKSVRVNELRVWPRQDFAGALKHLSCKSTAFRTCPKTIFV